MKDISPSSNPLLTGLTAHEAQRRWEQDGPNTVPDPTPHPLQRMFAKFWAPVPWMLEAAIALEIVLNHYVEAAIIAALLVFNAVLGFLQEAHAQATLAILKSRLALHASVKRDRVWQTVPAAQLVVGDLIKLSLGAIVPADVRLLDGSVLLDHSMLTGESIPIEAQTGFETYAGALVQRGEAIAVVTAIGAHTKFGKAAELVRIAHVESSQQKAVLRVVRNLALFSGSITILLIVYASILNMPLYETFSLVLTAVLASIPVALPATFTLAAAIGAKALAKGNILLTRLSAVDEAASIDVLCADKTGTLTRNELEVTSVQALSTFDTSHILGLAALASSEGGRDPVDAAIRAAAAKQLPADLPKLAQFIPFDPKSKMSEAIAIDPTGLKVRIVKGAFDTIAALVPPSPNASKTAQDLEMQGFRVLAIAMGPSLHFIGIIALSDPPRSDSAALIQELQSLGVRTVMVTGDAPTTATTVARAVSLSGKIYPPGPIPAEVSPEEFAIFAKILPEDKYHLVKAFQKADHIVGMCGDGANDAPALRQAQMGIAVSTATDVAKSAAGIVLTKPGLEGILASVKEGRVIFQRIQTYTMNSIIKKIAQMFLLAAGLFMTGHAVLTPLLMVIVMLTGDFLSMSLTMDTVRPSRLPNTWQIGRLTMAGVVIGICDLSFCMGVLAFGWFHLRLDLGALRTLAMIALIFGGEAVLYAIRERRRIWSSLPNRWIIFSSLIDTLIIFILSTRGIGMQAVAPSLVLQIFLAAILFAFILDFIKIRLFHRLGII